MSSVRLGCSSIPIRSWKSLSKQSPVRFLFNSCRVDSWQSIMEVLLFTGLERCQWDFAPQVVQTMELATVAKSLPGQKARNQLKSKRRGHALVSARFLDKA
eukprot:742251-Amphidinium_carterae.2